MELVSRLYAGLAQFMYAETGLGGKLLYAGEPGDSGSLLLRAANIGGAASLAASADAAQLRRAMREGALDFVVTSLDEALRILKNEIRKRQPASVGVSVAPEALLGAMGERGVLPDLLAPGLPAHPVIEAFRARGAKLVEPEPLPPGCSFHVFPIPADWKQPPAAFDALLLECFDAEDHVNRRWVRLAPRYLSSSARRHRLVVCTPAAALELRSRLQGASQR